MKIKGEGISLITLVITIIIVIILASVVILTLNKYNSIESANEAVFKNDLKTYQQLYQLYVSNKGFETLGEYKIEQLNANKDTIIDGKNLYEEIFGETIKKYETDIKIENGKLIYAGEVEKNIDWAVQIGYHTENVGEGTNNKKESAWNRPYIPIGFKYKEGTVATGFVIADGTGNEFVWIPVDGTNVVFERAFTTKSIYGSVSDDEYPSGITSSTEKSIIEKAGGFYVGRYEAGIPENQSAITGTSSEDSNTTGIPTIKKGTTSWTYIDYNNASINARAFINNNEIASGLLSGIQWDCLCQWLIYTNVKTYEELRDDSSLWGNFNNSTFSYMNSKGEIKNKEKGSNKKILTGNTEYSRTNNIYDIAGNVEEWTAERIPGYRIERGGSYKNTGDSFAAAARYSNIETNNNDNIGFRVALYIK